MAAHFLRNLITVYCSYFIVRHVLLQIVVALVVLVTKSVVILSLLQKIKFFSCLFRNDFGLGGDQSLADLPWFLVTLEQ